MGFADFRLEPLWEEVQVGDKVDVMAATIVIDPTGSKSLVGSTLGQKLLVVKGVIPDAPAVALLDVVVLQKDRHLTLEVTEGHVLAHGIARPYMFQEAIEVCSGIGCMGQGLTACGIATKASNELRKPFCELMTAHGRRHVVQGDLGLNATIASLHAIHGTPAWITSGFSCQPWSQLGDKRKTGDCRSSSLVHTLKAAFMLQSHTILLECVEGAGQDPEVTRVLDEFCRLTGYRRCHTELNLSDLVPSRRKRWWCVLTDRSMPSFVLQPLPKLSPAPVVGELLPSIPIWSSKELQQLELDRYETGKFQEFGGLASNLVTLDSVCKTALHGWSNQLNACPCTCRSYPLREERLKAKGIFGALIPTGGTIQTHFGDLPATRHLHPWEIALLNGMDPSLVWGDNLRLAIAAVGQLASPVQSCWIAAQVMAIRASLFDLEALHPAHCLWNHFVTMYRGVESTQPAIASHPTFRNYFARVHSALADVYTAGIGPTTMRPANLDGCTDRELSDAQTLTTSAQAMTPGIQATPGDRNACSLSCPGIQATPGNHNAWESTHMLVAEKAEVCAEHANAPVQSPGIQATPGHTNAWPCSCPGIQATPGQQNAWSCSSPGIQATPGQPNAWGTKSREGNDVGGILSHNPEGKPADMTCQDPLPAFQVRPRNECPRSCEQPDPKPLVTYDQADDPLNAIAKEPGIQATPGNLNAWDVSRPGIQATPGHNNAWSSPLQHCHSSAKVGGEQRHVHVMPRCLAEPTIAGSRTQDAHESLQKLPVATSGRPADTIHHAPSPEDTGPERDLQKTGTGAGPLDEVNPHKRVKTHHADLKPQCGGIAAFATGIPSQKEPLAIESATTTVGSSPDRGSFSQELLDWANEFDPPTDQKTDEHFDQVQTVEGDGHLQANDCPLAQAIQTTEDPADLCRLKHPVQVIRTDDSQPSIVQVEADTTVGSIALAEARLHVFSQPVRANTSVGTQLKCGDVTTPMQQIYLREMPGCGSSHSCISGCMPDLLKSDEPCPRLQLLHHQEGWVALDEITFYLAMLQVAGIAKVGEIMIMPESTLDEEMEPMLQRWMCRLAPFDATPGTIVTTLWVDHHWFPVAIKLHEGDMRVYTTPGGRDWLFLATRGLGNHISIHTIDCGSTFNNDCGFQAVGWLLQAALDTDFGTQGFKHTPVQIESACTWRSLFDHHLRACNTHLAATIPQHFIFGGTGNGELAENLAKLLIDRGVPSDAAKERAHLVIEKLGRHATPEQCDSLTRGENSSSWPINRSQSSKLSFPVSSKLPSN